MICWLNVVHCGKLPPRNPPPAPAPGNIRAMEPAGEPTVVAAPGIVVDVASTADGTVRWSVANDAPTAVSVDRVTLRWRVRTNGRVRVYRHGYQSWSATGTAVLGTAEDPSRTPGSIGLVRNVHHADADDRAGG